MVRKPLRSSNLCKGTSPSYTLYQPSEKASRPIKTLWLLDSIYQTVGKSFLSKVLPVSGETQINLWLTLTQVHLSSPAADSPFLTQGTNLHSTVIETALTLEMGVQELKNSGNSQCTVTHQSPLPPKTLMIGHRHAAAAACRALCSESSPALSSYQFVPVKP